MREAEETMKLSQKESHGNVWLDASSSTRNADLSMYLASQVQPGNVNSKSVPHESEP